MKTLALILASFVVPLLSAMASENIGFAKLYLRNLEQQIAVAKEKTEAPSAWQQCAMTLESLEENVAKLSDAERAPFVAKIKEYKPVVLAGAARNRASNIARRISDTLESARADVAAGNTKPAAMAEAYYDRLDKYFAEADLKALPAEELKKLKADYADLKKRAAK